MRIAIFIPCFNEEMTIAKVVRDCRKQIPLADIYVFDNNSTDSTVQQAKNAGAVVIHSPLQGKGHVVRHAFRKIEADIYVMLDGDDTYPTEAIPLLIGKACDNGYDMVIGTRLAQYSDKAFRQGHFYGNRAFSKLVSLLFRTQVTDLFSGFRVFTFDFVQTVALGSKGFEIETDLTLQAISKNLAIGEIPVRYRERPLGSSSKLRTFQDGIRILKFLFLVIKDYKPFLFFTVLAVITMSLSLMAGWKPILEYIDFSYVFALPRAVLAASLMTITVLLLSAGLILDSQLRYFDRNLRPSRSSRKESRNPETHRAS